MAKEIPSKLGLVLLLLVILLVQCFNECALASPQKLRPSSGWRRKMARVKSSKSDRGSGGGPGGGYHLPLPPPPPPPSPFLMWPPSSEQLPLP
ncbi:unnamed protein product [Thlaspi arvense]|uniref:Uncharacterized protein n=1 Tax=Thlaspi arvense TaxID=13288 RepID=A0AAU9RTE0_THLAR|nr:unnamed protein product [Thlaspi arvense]